MQEIAEALKINAVLSELQLPGNVVRALGAQALAEALKVNASVTKLDLNSNELGEAGARHLANALRGGNASLTELQLDLNRIGPEGAKAIADSLTHAAASGNQTLKKLDCGSNAVGDTGALAFAAMLRANTTLTELSLFTDGIEDAGVSAIAEALRSNTTLVSLNLNRNAIGPVGAAALAETLKSGNTTLTKLDLASSKFNDACVLLLAEALRLSAKPALTSLTLTNNGITDSGARALAEVFKVASCSLTAVSLGRNSITAEGGRALAEALKVNKTLERFDLSSTKIGCHGAQAVIDALKRNATIASLNLWDNSIGDTGALAVAEALRANSTLAILVLANNDIGDAGGCAIAEALQENRTLSKLFLEDNKLSALSAQSLAEALRVNSALRSLNLARNPLGDAGAASIVEALRFNSKLENLVGVDNGAVPLGCTTAASAGDLRAFAPGKFSSIALTSLGLVALPAELAHPPAPFANLAKLSLEGNTISSIPKLDLTFPALVELNLTGNPLGSFPEAFSQSLPTLKVLKLARTGLTGSSEVSSLIRAGKALEELDVSGNAVTLPEKNGKRKDGSSSSAPLPFVTAATLRILRAGNTLVDTIPAVPKGIKVLDLGGCALAFPDDNQALHLCDLAPELEELDLSGPALARNGPSSGGGGSSGSGTSGAQDAALIMDLVAGQNAYARVWPTEEARRELFNRFDVNRDNVLNLSEVPSFNAELLSHTPRLRDFPATLPPTLTSLNLSATLITTVPETALASLANLRTLRLAQCVKLESIPAGTGALPDLELLDVAECPLLRTVPQEIVKRGPMAVLHFVKSLAAGSEECYRIKLCVVGIGAAGKTSLLAALRDQTFNPVSDSTDGIKLDDWEEPVPGKSGRTLKLTTMDFAGQEVYLNTHSLFLGGRAMYVLAWNIRLGFDAGGVEFWLASIASRAPGATVLVVGTHADQVPMGSLPMETIKERFSRIHVHFFAVSSSTREGIAELRAFILSSALQQRGMGESLPRSWLKLEELLADARKANHQGSGKAVLTFAEVRELAFQSAISEAEEVERALTFLHDLASVLHYRGFAQLRDLVIIDPQWLMDAMARLVTAQKREDAVEGLERGIFERKDVATIWKV